MPETDCSPDSIAFRLLKSSDFPLLHRWLNTEHVRDGWFGPGSYPPEGYSLEKLTADFTPDLKDDSPITPLIFECSGRPIGYVQVWRVHDFIEYAGPFINDDTPPWRVASFDILIGDEEFVGQGLLPTILERLLEERVFVDPCVQSAIINPDSSNHRAIRGYEKCGFRHTHTIFEPGKEPGSHIMRIDRTALKGN